MILLQGSFLRLKKKRFEHYVVTRIWHLLDDLSVKFITQQYVTRPEGRALTDMFFPQLQIHIEIDEGYHKSQIEFDKLREADIINATGHELLRVDVTADIETINCKIAKFVDLIKDRKKTAQNFKDWDLEAEFNPRTYVDKGFIDLGDDCAFFRMVDAANCFGTAIKHKGIWSGAVKHKKEDGKVIWFPKLYPNAKWNNSISGDEMEIREISAVKEAVEPHIDQVLKENHKRIVFARVKGSLGDTMYRFKGEYELDVNGTNYLEGLLWRRISESVKTYEC